MNRFLPPVELRKSDGAGIVDLPSVQEICYDKYNAKDECDDLPNLHSAGSIPPIHLKQTEFSLPQFATRMGQVT